MKECTCHLSAPCEYHLSHDSQGRTREELIELQTIYAKKIGAPMFAPESGYCWRCKQDMVTEEWAVELITGCPKCNKSYCE